MAKLIISNLTEEVVGDLSAFTPEQRESFKWGAQRFLWYARNGDTVILPSPADVTFAEYVASITRVNLDEVAVLVPPGGSLGEGILTPDRLLNETFVSQLSGRLDAHPIDRVVALYEDRSVAELIRRTGSDHAMPGLAFVSQGGVELVNSKAAFRAIGAAAQVPIAAGIVTSRHEEAVGFIEEILAKGGAVMIKQEFSGGGLGNELVRRHTEVAAQGTASVAHLPGREDVISYVDSRWKWMTGGQGDKLIAEEFIHDAMSVYAEFEVEDCGWNLRGTGQLLMEPTAVGEVIPPFSLSEETSHRLIEEAEKLAERYHSLGYRGTLCADAVASNNGQLAFTEVNGRLTASTHLHVNVRQHILGSAIDRTVLERGRRLRADTFEGALDTLKNSGLAYDAETSTGVMFTANYVPVGGYITYTIVSHSIESAHHIEARLLSHFEKVHADD